MSAGALAFADVMAQRGGRVLFSGVWFALGAGDAALVTGRNGIGKSSLLRIAAGLLVPAAGNVRREGAVALQGEAAALDEDAELAAALRFWCRIDGGDAEVALESVGLRALADVPVRLLSTGQRRRAALARVVASGAAIWLLDEPASGLDAAAVRTLEALISRHRAGGGVVLAATHQPLDVPSARAVVLGEEP